jgi:predicted nucleotide-binding protein
MEIFIGCASERKDTMREIATWIEQKGYTPLPWDSATLFPLGDTSFQCVIDVAKREKLKGAIFIFGEDDQVSSRGVTSTQPRDNVLIEYGLFVGVLGVNKAIICAQGKPEFATNLKGIVYANVSPGNMSTARMQIEHWLTTL